MSDSPKYQALAAYARLSRKADGEIESVPLQKQRMSERAGREGWVITAWFDDDGLTAWDESIYRPGWEAYLKALGSGNHDGALTYHMDRLSRNGTDSERLLKITESRDLPILSPEQILEVGTNADARAMFRVQAAMNIHQSDSTSRRVMNTKNKARQLGILRTVYGGPPPLGFWQPMHEGKPSTPDWVIHEEASRYLTDAGTRVLAGEPVSAAYKALRRTYPAFADIREARLRSALQRPVSAGLITEAIPKKNRNRTRRVRGDGEIIGRAPGGGPIPEDMWHELQTVFLRRKKQGKPPKDNYPLGKILECAKCGNQLSGEKREIRRGDPSAGYRDYYRCGNPHKELKIERACRGVSVPADDLHEMIRAAMLEWAATPAGQAAAEAVPETHDEEARLIADINRYRDLIGDVEESLAEDLITKDRRDKTVNLYRAKIKQARRELEAVALVAASEPLQVLTDWKKRTPAQKRAAVAEAFMTPIKVLPGKGGPGPSRVLERVLLVPRR